MFAWRAHGGFIIPIGPIKLVPLTSRFWAGGGNSLRGWGPREKGGVANGIRTRDPEDHNLVL